MSKTLLVPVMIADAEYLVEHCSCSHRQMTGDVACHVKALADTVQRQRTTIGMLHDATILLRNAWSCGPEARDKAVQQATRLIDRAMDFSKPHDARDDKEQACMEALR